MEVFDFDSDILELVISKVIGGLAKDSAIAESVFSLIHMYLSIRP